MASPFTTGYQILLLVHIISMFVAFGGNFVQPMLARSGNVTDEGFAKANLYIQLPALVVGFIAALGLIGMSKPDGADEGVWQFSQTWVSIAMLVVIIAIVLQYLVARAWQQGKPKAVPGLTGGLHLCLVVALYLMIWKPGL